MTLHELQALHVKLVASLIKFTYNSGFQLTWGETYRTPAQAALNAQNGSGIAHSLHCDRLAVDFQLFKDGVYLTDPESYKFMGDYWKSLHELARWGGDFHTVDADHFSLTWNQIQ
ncbi:MAG: M15 family peptidase [Pseudomonadota bacterium]|nr:M15 family peptidase [Pseudomonadota bacterium]